MLTRNEIIDRLKAMKRYDKLFEIEGDDYVAGWNHLSPEGEYCLAEDVKSLIKEAESD